MMPMGNLAKSYLRAGQVVHVDGIPFYLAEDSMILGHIEHIRMVERAQEDESKVWYPSPYPPSE